MTRILFAVTAFAAALSLGCKSNASSSSTPPPVPAVSTVQASAAAPASSPPPAMVAPSGKMAHCPTVVTGATTNVADVPGAVELTITSPDAAATSEIRARASALVVDSKNGSSAKHTGGGGGGGIYGRCPVILRDVSLVAADVAGGTRLTVTPKASSELDWLRRETRDRLARLSAGQSLGEQKMAHCPSSVEGAKTALTTNPDGVTLVVTSQSADATKEIRARASHASSIAKAGPTGAAHNGGGAGGGASGRCPVVLTGTVVDVADVPGGSQITMKARSPDGVASLQNEAKERAAKFEAVATK